ncbi:MAG: NERD domain-containing protein [Solirubrobacterales bacterium]|nr:NERD domain-containing protein [Solirubrobacterales bacterium]
MRQAPATERSWLTGAVGEEMVAATLDAQCRDGVTVMHDRARPRSRANIDHLVIAPTGVWVVDTKRYPGRRVRVRRPLFGEARLTIDGRDRTKLVQGLSSQMADVAAVVGQALPAAPVHGAFCFVDAHLPLLGVPTIDGHLLLHRRSLVRHLNADGPLSSTDARSLTDTLAAAFPPTRGQRQSWPATGRHA